MRIGILTFHEVANAGAFLQAYATLKTLAALGHEASIINYSNAADRYNPWTYPIRHPSVMTKPGAWSKMHESECRFARCQQYLTKTQRFKTREAVTSQQFDAVVVGSDIVWNYEPWARGRDPIYFGQGLNAGRLVAFAPSCGNLSLDGGIPSFVSDGLSKFSSIAVRDTKTADLVERAVNRRPELIADPTFSLPLESLPETATYDEDYLLVYAINGTVDEATKNEVLSFARSKGLRIVAVTYHHDWVDANYAVSPFEWIERIRCARYVFTTAFHGTIFSMKLGKRFALKYSPTMEDKIRPMMSMLNCESRTYSTPGRLEAILESNWDVSAVQARIGIMGGQSTQYLKDSLS